MSGCGFVGLRQWLTAPMTRGEAVAEQRTRERLAALKRGEIPA